MNPTETFSKLSALVGDGDTAKLVMTLTAAAIASEPIGNSHHLLVPANYSHKDVTDLVEKAQQQPSRLRGTVHLKSVDSLLQYCADQKAQSSGYIYADPDALAITAVFNDQRASTGWRDHTAKFKAEHTPEFARWFNHGTNEFSQTEFAEFIEDNLADIAEPAAQQLLEVATTIQATTGINFSSAKRLQDGQTQLSYTENITATAGANGALSIPKEFVLGLRIFKNGDGYRLKARLKYRLHSGGVKFRFELDRPERAVEDAFAGYVAKVRESSGYTVLLGAP